MYWSSTGPSGELSAAVKLVELNSRYSEIADLNAEVLSVSVDDLSGAQYLSDSIGIVFPILYDPETDVVSKYGVYNLLGDGLATPSTFIIDKDGVIQWKYVGRSKDDRPSMQRVLEQLTLLN